jgi:uncharacterized protein with HEPN domain
VIAHNIELAYRFVGTMSVGELAEDEFTFYAVTRCLEVISEASRRLPADFKLRHPEVPWKQIAGAGNIYRHDYEDVVAGLVWMTVRERLAELESAVRAELS